MATAVLRLLNQEAAFRSLRLRAKAKMCANDQILCHEEYCRFAKDYAPEAADAPGSPAGCSPSTRRSSPDDVFAAARGAEVCPFEVSLEPRRPLPGHGLRLQLRLRSLRRPARLRPRRRPLRRRAGDRRGPQPGRPRPRLLQPGAVGGGGAAGGRGGRARRRRRSTCGSRSSAGSSPALIEETVADALWEGPDAASAPWWLAAARGRASGGCARRSTPPSSTTWSTSARRAPSAPRTPSSSSTSTSCAS